MPRASDPAAAILQQMNVGVLAVDAELRITHWNRFLELHSGRKAAEVVGRDLFATFPELDRPWLERKIRSVFLLRNYSFTSWRDRPYLFRFALTRPATGGSDVMRQDCTLVGLRDDEGNVRTVALILLDATETSVAEKALDAALAEVRQTHAQLQREVSERQAMEVELRKSHRLEAVEHLSAGVAHEVNTPLQFMLSSSSFLRDAWGSLARLSDEYRALCRQAGVADEAIAAIEERAELDYWRDEIPRAVTHLEEGLNRVARIIATLKSFAGSEASVVREVDVNATVEDSLRFSAPLYEGVADVEVELGELPPVSSPVGALGQVFMSLVSNAAQAIQRTHGAQNGRGKIRVVTERQGDEVLISISDTGTGIPPEIRARVFDLFFTTNDVGQGLGAGLALAYATVVKEHRGTLTFTTEMGRGTTFYVRLPIRQRDVKAA